MRRLSIGIGVAFVLAAILRLIDLLNLVATAPVLPEGTNLVDLVLGAIGLLLAAARFGGRELPDGWAWLSVGTAVLVVAWVVLSFLGMDDIGDVILLLTIGILVPIWSIWLGLRFKPADG